MRVCTHLPIFAKGDGAIVPFVRLVARVRPFCPRLNDTVERIARFGEGHGTVPCCQAHHRCNHKRAPCCHRPSRHQKCTSPFGWMHVWQGRWTVSGGRGHAMEATSGGRLNITLAEISTPLRFRRVGIEPQCAGMDGQAFVEIGWFLFLPLTLLVPTHTHARAQNTMRCADRVRARLEAMRIRAASFKFGPRPTVLARGALPRGCNTPLSWIHFWNLDRSNLNLNAVLWLCKQRGTRENAPLVQLVR